MGCVWNGRGTGSCHEGIRTLSRMLQKTIKVDEMKFSFVLDNGVIASVFSL